MNLMVISSSSPVWSLGALRLQRTLKQIKLRKMVQKKSLAFFFISCLKEGGKKHFRDPCSMDSCARF